MASEDRRRATKGRPYGGIIGYCVMRATGGWLAGGRRDPPLQREIVRGIVGDGFHPIPSGSSRFGGEDGA